MLPLRLLLRGAASQYISKQEQCQLIRLIVASTSLAILLSPAAVGGVPLSLGLTLDATLNTEGSSITTQGPSPCSEKAGICLRDRLKLSGA